MKHEAFLHLQEELKEVPFESWLRNSRYYTLSTFSAQKPCTSVARIIINGEEVSYTLPIGEYIAYSKRIFGYRSIYIYPSEKDFFLSPHHPSVQLDTFCEPYSEGPIFSLFRNQEPIFSRLFAGEIYDDLDKKHIAHKAMTHINTQIKKIKESFERINGDYLRFLQKSSLSTSSKKRLEDFLLENVASSSS